MNNKKIGYTLIGISGVLGGVMVTYITRLSMASQSLMCGAASSQCATIASSLNLSHLAVGMLAAALSLGVYMVAFRREDPALARTKLVVREALNRIEQESGAKMTEEKFSAVMKALTDNERRILQTVKNHEGITQHMLRLKTGLSKAKVSSVLTEFQKRGLVRKEEQGKTFSVYLSDAF